MLTLTTGVGLIYFFTQGKSESDFGSTPGPQQTAKIANMIGIIQGTAGFEKYGQRATQLDVRIFSQREFPAWGYDPNVRRDLYFLADELIADVHPVLASSTIVHEMEHTYWLPGFAASYRGEQAAYQVQSDYLRAHGVVGTKDQVSALFPASDGSFFKDLAESFRYYRIEHPAITE